MTYRSKVATVFLLGFFLDLINMFIASVAFPAMGRTLHASVGELAWVSNGYIAGLTTVLPFGARLSQQFGARRVFLLSLSLFSLGALAAGMADSLISLVMWRALQGMGGGLLIPLGQALTAAVQASRTGETFRRGDAGWAAGAGVLSGARRSAGAIAELALGFLCQPADSAADVRAGRAVAQG